MVAESWLNERAIGINRGQRFGIHQVLVYLGATLGQNLLGVRDVAAPDLFSIAAITLTLAPVPVAMTASTAPKPIRRLRVDLRWLAGISPLALTGCPLVGAVNGAIWSLAPIYAQSQGLAPNEVGWFMALLITGGAVSQSPVGKVSDRPDRRWMIIAVALISSAAGIALVVSCEGGLRLLADHLFPVRRACERHRRLRALRRGRERHAADVRDRRHAGPLIASGLMEARDMAMLFAYAATLHLALALFCIWCCFSGRSPPSGRPSLSRCRGLRPCRRTSTRGRKREQRWWEARSRPARERMQADRRVSGGKPSLEPSTGPKTVSS